LGCIAYELLAGRRPFDVPNPGIEAMWFQHAKVDPVAPTRLNQALPAHIEQTILKAMAKERNERYANISVFIGALQNPAILQKTARQYLIEGKELHKAGRYEEAIVAYKQVIRLDPENVDTYFYKSIVIEKLGRLAKARPFNGKA
jgi:tetratricopeptide (TPR) repeat protein